MVRSAGDPQAMLQQVMGQNPQYSQVMNYINQNGGDAQKAFYNLAGQMGVDPEQIIKALN